MPPLLPTFPVSSPAAWRGCDLRASAAWSEILTTPERTELLAAWRELGARSPDSVPPPAALRETFTRWRGVLREGRGFVLVRGVPTEGLSRDEAGGLFRLLGQALGTAVPQTQAGERLCDVRDTGADPRDPHTRLYATRAEQDFHTDGADIIGLLCLRSAKSGGASRIVSSVTVVNELARRHPGLVPLLFEPWRFHLPGPQQPGFPAFFDLPICRWDGRSLATFYIGWYLRNAQILPDAVPLRREQLDLLAALEEVANDPALYLDMEFAPGDIQWLKNATVLHKRTAYEDFAEEDRKRHLLRLWLAAPDFDDGDARLRRGLTTEAESGEAP